MLISNDVDDDDNDDDCWLMIKSLKSYFVSDIRHIKPCTESLQNKRSFRGLLDVLISLNYLLVRIVQRKLPSNCYTNPHTPSVRAIFDLVSLNQNQGNYSGQSQQTLTSQWTNENSKRIHVTGAKRGKTRAGESRLVLVWLPIGWESSAKFTNQSKSTEKQNQSKREITFDTQLESALSE